MTEADFPVLERLLLLFLHAEKHGILLLQQGLLAPVLHDPDLLTKGPSTRRWHFWLGEESLSFDASFSKAAEAHEFLVPDRVTVPDIDTAWQVRTWHRDILGFASSLRRTNALSRPG